MRVTWRNIRRALGPGGVASIIVAVATALISWIGAEQFNLTTGKVVRETVWQDVGIAGIATAVAALAVPFWAYWFSNPARGSRAIKTATLTLIVFGLIGVAGWVFGSLRPFEDATERGIYLRGAGIGGIAMAAFGSVIYLIATENERHRRETEELEYAVEHHRQLLEDNGIDWKATF